MAGDLQILGNIAFRKNRMAFPGQYQAFFYALEWLSFSDVFTLKDNFSICGDPFTTFALFFNLHIDDKA
jgi:hypothetical protein